MITARSFLTNAQFSLTCWTRHKQASRKSQDHRDRRSCSLSIYLSHSLPLSGERRSRVWAARVTRSWLRTRAAVSREQTAIRLWSQVGLFSSFLWSYCVVAVVVLVRKWFSYLTDCQYCSLYTGFWPSAWKRCTPQLSLRSCARNYSLRSEVEL